MDDRQPHLRRLVAGLVMLAAGMAMNSAAAETVYRCAGSDGSVVFSDTPCDQQALPYKATRRLSVIDPPPRLEERIAANQAFLEQRRARLQRPQPPETTAPAPVPRRPATDRSSPPLLQVPYWPPPTAAPHPERQPTPRADRFSALSGRFPGTDRRRPARQDPPDDQ
ncbi:MAG: DUF4124 domain-containing protein [Wenzhouxiangella sp.]